MKTFIKKLVTFNIPLIFSIVYIIIRLPRKYFSNKSIGLFVVLLISEAIRRMTGIVIVLVICFNETVWEELKGLFGKKQGNSESAILLARITNQSDNSQELNI